MSTLDLPSSEDWSSLGIDTTTSYADARRAYRLAARESHPDVSSGDAERFRQVTVAWERIAASLQWRDIHGLASAASIEDEAAEFDEVLDPEMPDWGRGSDDTYATASLFERFVRRLGRAIFLSGRFPEREWPTLVTLATATCLALFVHAGVHPAGLAYSLASLILALVVGRIVALPTRLGL